MIYLLTGLLATSLAINALLFYLYFKKKPQKAEYTADAKALLADLLSGPALLRIEYVDRGDVFLRSPRHT